ncbi:glutathione S-transferase domain-containing protein [Thermoleophilia bacterium SCSIO 60948]|nr:glutathione S-transferase domain-containing protein [Thermoleophilia bacterium SCSIO 60948]
MKLYVCWNAKPGLPIGGGMHPCGKAYKALADNGYDPEVVKVKGSRMLPGKIGETSGRREIEELTGRQTVPVLVTDNGAVIAESSEIVAWAQANPA